VSDKRGPEPGSSYSFDARGAVIGAVGDDAQVNQYFGHAGGPLSARLRQPYTSLPSHSSPLSLVLAQYRVVGFDSARSPILEALRTWCLSERPLVTLLTGAAGVGKTRLAAELAHLLLDEGWSTGFLLRSPAPQAGRMTDDQAPLLVMIDYADTRPDLADDLVQAQSLRETGLHVKVLLISRGAGSWWKELPAAGNNFAVLHAALQGAIIHDLFTDLSEASHLNKQYTETALAFAAQQDLEPPTELPVLDSSASWSYLLVALAALDATGTPDAPGRRNAGGRPRGPTEVLDGMLDRERMFWRQSADAGSAGLPAPSRRLLSRTVLCLSLLGAVDETDAVGTLRQRVPELGDANEERLGDLAAWVRGLYPAVDVSAGWTAGMQPDLLAERFAVLELSGEPVLARRLLIGLEVDQAERALTVLGRALHHSSDTLRLLRNALEADPRNLIVPAAYVAAYSNHQFDRCLSEVLLGLGSGLTADLQTELVERLPRHEGALRWTAVALGRLAVDQARASGDQQRLASELTNFNGRLLALGLYGDAVAVADEAVRLRRQLHVLDAQRHAPALARALNQQSNSLAKVERREEALRAAEESLTIRVRLAKHDPESYRPALAKGFNTLGNRLSEIAVETGEATYYSDASDAFRQGEELYDEFSRVYDADRANVLSNQARVLAPLKRRDEAWHRLEKASRLYRNMRADALEKDLPGITVGLARSLSNLAVLTAELCADGDCERVTQGLAAAEEAAAHLEPLAEAYPQLHEEQLTSVLRTRDELRRYWSAPRFPDR
jgi:hypothetical protein